MQELKYDERISESVATAKKIAIRKLELLQSTLLPVCLGLVELNHHPHSRHAPR